MAGIEDRGQSGAARGGAALELSPDNRRVFLRLNRVACARVAEVLSQAAASPAGALQTGSEEAEELTACLNKSLGRSGVVFGEVSLDDSLPHVVPRARTLGDRLRFGAGAIAMLVAALAFFRGLFVLLNDGWTLVRRLF